VRGTSTINPMLNYLESMLNELLKQGKVNYNVAALVDRLPVKAPIQTFTTVEVERLLDTFAEDRLGHVWHLALAGLRRSEPCGLRWTDIDFEARHSRPASRSPAQSSTVRSSRAARSPKPRPVCCRSPRS
jgi:integrase